MSAPSFDQAIKELEKLTGKKFDQEKFDQACANANRTASAWLRVCDYLQYKPAPYSGFDLFNHMADIRDRPVPKPPGRPRPSSCWRRTWRRPSRNGTSTNALPREVPRHVRRHPLLAQAAQPV